MNNTNRPSKRQRRDQPVTPLDHESLACVASPVGPISTTPVSSLDKEIIVSRFQKEICAAPFDLHLSIPRGNKITTASGGRKTTTTTTRSQRKPLKSLARRVLESRLSIGTNQCTKALQNNRQKVALVVLCRDVHPPSILAHIPYLTTVVNKSTSTSLVLLPGRASLDLGHAMGIKKCAILAFSKRNLEDEAVREGLVDDSDQVDKYHARIDSFIEFVKDKL
jgi:ribosomal protein L7Ae-like RNA K-turn-binding protein